MWSKSQIRSTRYGRRASRVPAISLVTGVLLSISVIASSATFASELPTSSPVTAHLDVKQSPVPGAFIQQSGVVSDPSNQPDDLVRTATTVASSVVTVRCQSAQGSGWAAKVELPSTLVAAGFGSFIVTANEVVDACAADGTVSVILPDQQKVQGKVFTTDSSNNLASVLIPTQLPMMDWQGVSPQQGWWVGVIGSPLGFPGVLGEGVVTSISLSSETGTTDAHLNAGNAGSPVFDRNGRVLGVAVGNIQNTEGLGQFVGAPLLCVKIIQCTAETHVWIIDPAKASADADLALAPASGVVSDSARKNQPALLMATQDELSGARAVLAQSLKALQSAKTKYPTLASKIAALIHSAPSMPSLTGVMYTDVTDISKFAKSAALFNRNVESTLPRLIASVTPVKKSVTCTKGAFKKIVTGANPVCPTGYKVSAKK